MSSVTLPRYAVLLLSICLLAPACDEFLEEDFRDGITTEDFFNNDAEARLAVNGVYRILYSNALYRQRGLDDYLVNGADVVGPSRNVNGLIHNYLIDEGVADGYGTWNALYEMARNTALFINRIDGNENLSEETRNQALGELLFLRALAFFHLTNLWGDVPYFRELPSTEELAEITRTEKETIRTDMKADLERAIGLLPGEYASERASRATKWAATALKAQYHLYDREWQPALDACISIIENSPHRLLDNFADVFDQSDPANQFNDELIYVVDFTRDPVFGLGNTPRTDDYTPRIRDEPANRNDRPGGPGTPTRVELYSDLLASFGEGMTGFGWAIPLPEIADSTNWEAGDLRYHATVVSEYRGYELSFPYYRKNWNLDQTNSPRGNHPENYYVFRLADIYLMAAEAENELNGPDDAYAYVNAVRERAFDPDKPWSGMSQEEFRRALYDERKYELAAEGGRRMDLIRWGILLETVKNTEHRPWNNPAANIQPYHVLLPIPLEEIQLNPTLLESDPSNNGYR